MSLAYKPRVRFECKASAKNGQVHNAIKRFIDKRNVTVKNNLSRLMTIGLNDIKDVYQVLKELDDIHKKAVDDFGKAIDNEFNSVPTSKNPTVEPDTIFEPEK